jgi:DNA-binding response OmpR family regulator
MVVEDDESIGASVEAALIANGYAVDRFLTGQAATAAVMLRVPDLVVLDVGLPDIDGFSLCRWLRQQHAELPILMVTARDAEIDIIVGLDAGATDYVTKPFSMNILLARIRAHLRGSSIPDPDAPLELGLLTVHPTSYSANIANVPLDLRPREFQLLAYLVRHAGRVVTREQILSDVWDTHWDTATKTVDMHIVALRRALGDAVTIVNIRGVGFRIEAS